MQTVKKKLWHRLLPAVLSVLLLIGLFNMMAPAAVQAAEGDITISSPGLNNGGIIITQSQLREIEPHMEIYSTIDTWPTKKWYAGQGVRLAELLELASGLKDEATQIRFTFTDGAEVAFTVQEIVYGSPKYLPRYRFPNFMDTGLSGHLPGDPSGAVPVEAIIAYKSCSADKYDDVNEDNLSATEGNRLLYGQLAVTQQNNARCGDETTRFDKYVTKIEVLAEQIDKWNGPTAEPGPGEVPVGTKVKLKDTLNGTLNDENKIYYTTDGSAPTLDSPIYNWISECWREKRQDFDEINKPIEINEDTTIRAFVAGPGKENSEVATFEYQVDSNADLLGPPALTADTIDNVVGKPIELTFADDPAWRAAITDVAVDGTSIAGKYTVTDGKIKIDAGVFTAAKDYTIVVSAEGYEDAEVIQTIKASGPELKQPPVLTADTINNVVGNSIELTFADDSAWRAAISGVAVNGTSITGKYTVTDGKIKIDASVFPSAGSYEITVMASGYSEATVTQEIIDSGEVALTITGDGVTTPKRYSRSQLEAMPQIQEVYSCINTWPTKKWYVGRGVSLRDLLNEAGIKGNAQQIKFVAKDGYYMTLTVQELLSDRRYRFPNFKTGGGDGDGHIPGDAYGAKEVETILGLISAEGSDNPDYMNALNSLLLMLGQRAVTEQTGPMFVKNVNRIEVLTDPPGKWDKPKAEPSGGTVPAGTKVRLSNNHMDQDKIHYTTDGSTPTLDSPIYNWIAKRWWSSRGDETVEKINHPIALTKDITIKAITIGPGKSNSDVATFYYKVTGASISATDEITPDNGGTVSLEDEAVIEIPAGALKGTSPVEVKIERVTKPPAAPAGFKIFGDVYEFSVGGETSYGFNKKVTIKLSFDPEKLGEDETPAIHYYDEKEKKWVNIGGVVFDNFISVQVDHFTKFAVMVAGKHVAAEIITPDKGGTVNLEDEAIIEIPPGVLKGTAPVEVKIERVTKPPAAPAGFKILGDVYEFSVGGETSCSFNKKVTIKLNFDPEKLGEDETPAIHYYDEKEKKWVNIGGEVSDNFISVQVDHFTKFAVMIEVKQEELILTDIAGHWAENSIKELVALGIISGYPDGTFRPDNKITRAEFAALLVRALKLEPHSGEVFADTAGHWAQNTIATAAYHDIVSGYDADTFGPNDSITREQMAAMMVRAAKLGPVTEEVSFADSGSISGWARIAMATAVKNGIINGYPDNTVRPLGNATRAEAVTVIVNALHKLKLIS